MHHRSYDQGVSPSKGVPVQEGGVAYLSWEGLSLGGFLSRGSLSRGLCLGEFLSREGFLSGRGLFPRGLCPGGQC